MALPIEHKRISFCPLSVCSGCLSSKAEDRLFRKLFRRYNQFIRPVENVSDPVTVEFEVSISQLVKVVSHARTRHDRLFTHVKTTVLVWFSNWESIKTKMLLILSLFSAVLDSLFERRETPSCERADHIPYLLIWRRRQISRGTAEVKSPKWIQSLFSLLDFTDLGNVTQRCYTLLLFCLGNVEFIPRVRVCMCVCAHPPPGRRK